MRCQRPRSSILSSLRWCTMIWKSPRCWKYAGMRSSRRTRCWQTTSQMRQVNLLQANLSGIFWLAAPHFQNKSKKSIGVDASQSAKSKSEVSRRQYPLCTIAFADAFFQLCLLIDIAPPEYIQYISSYPCPYTFSSSQMYCMLESDLRKRQKYLSD